MRNRTRDPFSACWMVNSSHNWLISHSPNPRTVPVGLSRGIRSAARRPTVSVISTIREVAVRRMLRVPLPPPCSRTLMTASLAARSRSSRRSPRMPA
ncbi:hypothetical protein FHS43_006114 [Streptosporangium becharense]|uniref:Uncharacterized protein n=1 Tax=Streptosporangium becharense TaxID=1816182 RepID=A0A7W9IGR0_9ACTN|nr:hypothetical protein [Streptosporangium becharense]MBB2914802.1 hypothetical protein [Streptosporangium becharense]MBB5820387.1 hypothetical protein [Streptosporangium becharense]